MVPYFKLFLEHREMGEYFFKRSLYFRIIGLGSSSGLSIALILQLPDSSEIEYINGQPMYDNKTDSGSL